jgi:hypothetical protein
MPLNTIAFFSSDARDLYKADVFRVLALPKNHSIQFRYQRKYIDAELLANLDQLKGKEGCVFLVTGNTNPDALPAERTLELFSIRKVKILDYYNDTDKTQQIYFYLELLDFCDYEIHRDTSTTKLPSNNIFVSNLVVNEGPNNSWINRIERIKTAFPAHLFFNISKIRENESVIKPIYSSTDRLSYFDLKDESKYHIDMSFYDLGEGTSILSKEIEPTVLSSNVPTNFRVNAPLDTRTFTIQTKSLIKQQEVTTLRFGQSDKMEVYHVDLQLNIERGFWKPFQFGFLTSLAVLGIIGTQLVSKKVDELQNLLSFWNFGLAIFSLLAVGAASAYLFQFFNKK